MSAKTTKENRYIHILTLLLVLILIGGPSNSLGADARAESLPPADILPPAILFYDTGINPYHIDFRLPENFDPFERKGYYPPEATLIELSSDAENLEQALERDQHVWDALEPGTLYAFNGTRIVGAIQSSDCSSDCIWDHNGHGTIVASSAAGRESGTCPECRIVVHTGLNKRDEFNEWAYRLPWIDMISVSAGNLFGVGTQFGNFSQQSQKWTDSGRPWFVANGNGGSSGGHVNYFADQQGPPWIFRVGMYRVQDHFTQGYTIVAPPPHPVADHRTMDGYRSGGGTSGASPAAAGHAAMVLWEARKIFNDADGWRDGALAHAAPGVDVPEMGPLSDGRLSGKELEDLLRVSAREIPHSAVLPPHYNPGPHSWWVRGFGLVDEESMPLAYEILRGDADPVDKPWEWWWHDMDQYVRDRHGGWTQYCLNIDDFDILLLSGMSVFLSCMFNQQPDLTEVPRAPPDHWEPWS